MTQQRHSTLAIHPTGEHGVRRVRTWHRLRSGFVIVLALLLIGGGLSFWRSQSQAKALAAATAKNTVVTVAVVHPEMSGSSQALSLPGTLLGMVESPISARASGYLTRWTRDIGAPVKKGELLAEISSPEVEQQLAQAVASRALSTTCASGCGFRSARTPTGACPWPCLRTFWTWTCPST